MKEVFAAGHYFCCIVKNSWYLLGSWLKQHWWHIAYFNNTFSCANLPKLKSHCISYDTGTLFSPNVYPLFSTGILRWLRLGPTDSWRTSFGRPYISTWKESILKSCQNNYFCFCFFTSKYSIGQQGNIHYNFLFLLYLLMLGLLLTT